MLELWYSLYSIKEVKVFKCYLIDKIFSYIGLILDYDEELLENIGLVVDFEYMMDGSFICYD